VKENMMSLLKQNDKFNEKIFKAKAKLTRLEQKRNRVNERIDNLKVK
jgi:cell division protein FtsB